MARPDITQRDRLLELLREHAGDGLTLADIEDDGLAAPGPHLESLRREGFGIESLHGRDHAGRPITRHYLRRDAWADAA